jgi:hypothetical protein
MLGQGPEWLVPGEGCVAGGAVVAGVPDDEFPDDELPDVAA